MCAKYRKTAQGGEKVRDAVYRSIKKHKYKQDARDLLNSALRKKVIVKPAQCSDCGSETRIEGHHEDYTKPLVVLWLCTICHARRHRRKV